MNDFVEVLHDFIERQVHKGNPTDEYYLGEDEAKLLNEVCRAIQDYYTPDFDCDEMIDPHRIIHMFNDNLIQNVALFYDRYGLGSVG